MPATTRQLANVLLQIEAMLSCLAPRPGTTLQLLADGLRRALHQSTLLQCPMCNAIHFGLDAPDGAVVVLHCSECNQPFELAIDGLGGVAVSPCRQLPMAYDSPGE